MCRFANRIALDQVLAKQLAAKGRTDVRYVTCIEFMGFAGPDVREGVASLREKRKPDFDKRSPFLTLNRRVALMAPH